MSRKAVFVSSLAFLLVATSAQAVVLTNRDDKEHKLTIIEGENRVERTVKPSEVIENFCLKGCVIRLNDSEEDEYELDGPETVSIEEGFLYYDGPEGQVEGQPGGTGTQPSAPGAAPAAPAIPPAANPGTPAAPAPATPPTPAPKQ